MRKYVLVHEYSSYASVLYKQKNIETNLKSKGRIADTCRRAISFNLHKTRD